MPMPWKHGLYAIIADNRIRINKILLYENRFLIFVIKQTIFIRAIFFPAIFVHALLVSFTLESAGTVLHDSDIWQKESNGTIPMTSMKTGG